MPTLPRSVIFIDALSDDKVEAMRLQRDYAGHAELELERRADAKRAEWVAGAARLRACVAEGLTLGPQVKRMLEIVCECGGDRSAVIEKLRADRKVVCWPCGSPRTREEQMEEVEEKHREWLRKRQSRGSPA